MSAPQPQPRSLETLAAHCGISPEQLLPELYQSLRRIAHRHLLGERAGHSMGTTALVNEAWLKLVASYPEFRFPAEGEFLALSGHLMRRVLTDHARHQARLKYGGHCEQVTYTDSLNVPAGEVANDDILALDRALLALQEFDARQVQVVELRYFSGFSIEETAELMALSPATVKREWAMARAWLIKRLRSAE